MSWIQITPEEIEANKEQDREYEQLVKSLEAKKKSLTAELGPLDSERQKLSAKSGKLQAKRASIDEQIAVRLLRMERPWTLILTSPRVHDSGTRDLDFDSAGFNPKTATQFLQRIEQEIRELRGERLTVQMELEPLEAELRELFLEWQSLQAQIENCRPPDRQLFELEWNRQKWLARAVR